MLFLLLMILIQRFHQCLLQWRYKTLPMALQWLFQKIKNFVKTPGMNFASKLQTKLNKSNQQLFTVCQVFTCSDLSHKRWPSLFVIIILSEGVCGSLRLQIKALYLSSISCPRWISMPLSQNSVNQLRVGGDGETKKRQTNKWKKKKK